MSFVNSKLLGSRKTVHWASWVQTERGQEPEAPAFHVVTRTRHFSMPVTVIYVSSFSSNVHIYALLRNAEKGVYSYASQAPSPSGFLLGPAIRGTQRKSGMRRRAGGLPLSCWFCQHVPPKECPCWLTLLFLYLNLLHPASQGCQKHSHASHTLEFRIQTFCVPLLLFSQVLEVPCSYSSCLSLTSEILLLLLLFNLYKQFLYQIFLLKHLVWFLYLSHLCEDLYILPVKWESLFWL